MPAAVTVTHLAVVKAHGSSDTIQTRGDGFPDVAACSVFSIIKTSKLPKEGKPVIQ